MRHRRVNVRDERYRVQVLYGPAAFHPELLDPTDSENR
jgi:hypothetical protein